MPAAGHKWGRCFPGAFRDLRHGAAGGNRTVLCQDCLAVLIRPFILVLDQQPVVALAAEAIALHAYEHEASLELLSGEDEFQFALGQRLVDVLVTLG